MNGWNGNGFVCVRVRSPWSEEGGRQRATAHGRHSSRERPVWQNGHLLVEDDDAWRQTRTERGSTKQTQKHCETKMHNVLRGGADIWKRIETVKEKREHSLIPEWDETARGGAAVLRPPSPCVWKKSTSRGPFLLPQGRKGGWVSEGTESQLTAKLGFRRPAFHSFAERIVLSGGSTDRPPPIL